MGSLLTPWNIGIWVSWLVAFCVREALAVWWSRCPWDTFSRFVWDLQAKWEFATVGVVAVIAILASHLIRLASIREGDRVPVREQIAAARITRARTVIQKQLPKIGVPDA